MILGNKFKINNLFALEDTDTKLEINFDGTDLEDKYEEIQSVIGEKIEILEIMKELYDTLFLKKLFKGSNETNISSLMVKKYNDHKEDLKFLNYSKFNNNEIEIEVN